MYDLNYYREYYKKEMDNGLKISSIVEDWTSGEYFDISEDEKTVILEILTKYMNNHENKTIYRIGKKEEALEFKSWSTSTYGLFVFLRNTDRTDEESLVIYEAKADGISFLDFECYENSEFGSEDEFIPTKIHSYRELKSGSYEDILDYIKNLENIS